MSVVRLFSSILNVMKPRHGKSRDNNRAKTTDEAIRTGKICPYCGGSGIRNDIATLPLQPRCSACGGTGRIPL